ncbi:MAG: 3-phosphoshikimate 1-carboxyvinyltransferase [Acidimicrobiales bacterium]
MDTLAVEPLPGPVSAVVVLPGSKSITNRALVFAALAAGTSTVRGVLDADDTEAMVGVLRGLGSGLTWDRSQERITVTGWAARVPPAPDVVLDVRSSGTTARFVLPLLLAGSGPYRVDASAQMRARPMGETFRALRVLGAKLEPAGAPDALPVTVSVGPADPGTSTGAAHVSVAGDVSSQFLSGLLLAGPCLAQGLVVETTTPLVSRPYVDMTIAVMRAFGATVTEHRDGNDGGVRFAVAAGGYRAVDYVVEPDASAASYPFAAAALTGSAVRVEGLGRASVQGDVAFVDVLARMGARVEVDDEAITVIGAGLVHGIDADLRDLSDTVPTFAAVAAFADGPSRATGVGFIRRKESDRIAAVVTELGRAGLDAAEEPDGLVVHPGVVRPARFATYGDHRMAMATALIGLRVPGCEIEDPGCVAKTFPGFWAMLDSLRAAPAWHGVLAIDGPAGAGKSTVAKAVAARLGLAYLDTGAQYRTVALAALRRGVDLGDADAVVAVARAMSLVEAGGRVLLDGDDVTAAIRTAEASQGASRVAVVPGVRRELQRRQRRWAIEHGGGVAEGRDLGTVVYPHARLKLFVTASVDERARRRSAETGEDAVAVAAAIAERDRRDAGRTDDPMRAAADAVIVDTTGRTVEAVVDDVCARWEPRA